MEKSKKLLTFSFLFVATESVRSLTQSASFDAGFNQGIFHKSHEDSLDCQASAKSSVNSNSSSQIGLFKVCCVC